MEEQLYLMMGQDEISYQQINYEQAIQFLLPRHYSGRKPTIMYSFGVIQNGELKAVCTFGKPSSPTVCDSICGKEYSSNVIQLNRLCRVEGYKEPLSKLVSFALNQLKKLGDFIVVSYSDTAMNHHGYIYQATNFLYTGQTQKHLDNYSQSGKHNRHLRSECGQNRRIQRSIKHRYIYFVVRNKTRKKQMRSALRFEVKKYPKGQNKNYVLGEYLKPKVIYVDKRDIVGE